MSAPKAKAATSGRAKKATEASTNGASAPAVNGSVEEKAPVSGSGKPDKAAYDAEQDTIKVDIDALQVKLSAVREKISLVSKSGAGNDRRNDLRNQLDEMRGKQSNNKVSRNKIHEQIKAIQESIQKKVGRAAHVLFTHMPDQNNRTRTCRLPGARRSSGRSRMSTRTSGTFHVSIPTCQLNVSSRNLEKQVESGSMKLADEKRALQEISQSKRLRRTVEGFQAEIDTIEADRAKLDELHKQLDDPEAIALSQKYNTIKDELDELKKESDEVYASRNKLFDERNDLQVQIDALYNRKRESAQKYREANDRYWAKVNEDKARRAERARAQRAADEEQKKKELAERLREEAAQPAFQIQIEDCQTLIDYFNGKPSATASASVARVLADEPKLDLRKVEAGPAEGLVVRKKKGEDEESYFVGGKGKGKGKKGNTKAVNNGADASSTSSASLHVPLPTLSALLSLSIPPPSSSADIPRVVDDLNTKKAWFEANQARVTAEAIAKAEADIQRLTGGKTDTKGATVSEKDVSPPNGGGENPAEPVSTPQVKDLPVTAVASDDVTERLEEVKEEQVEAEAAES
ncbi:hypothetical protein EVG20_g4142 [Dentipellis fragilis]|uniref:Nuclear segregation protein Bfr1 n=1 Tax=Dentipellis fragilis TaxID=205917 RepID=A0A4Y9YXG0_9AGAM|nr:hypothetical protein EVG20_g4142 [Dentipellis fragilis]